MGATHYLPLLEQHLLVPPPARCTTYSPTPTIVPHSGATLSCSVLGTAALSPSCYTTCISASSCCTMCPSAQCSVYQDPPSPCTACLAQCCTIPFRFPQHCGLHYTAPLLPPCSQSNGGKQLLKATCGPPNWTALL